MEKKDELQCPTNECGKPSDPIEELREYWHAINEALIIEAELPWQD